MADQMEEVDSNNDCESISEPPQKRTKNEESADAPEAKTITNIYYDCLERIFDFLDVEDLLNVANTCKRLQTAAAAKIGDEFNDFCFELYPSREPEIYSSLEMGTINVYGLNNCLRVLRCFGTKIEGLFLGYEMAKPLKTDYVAQYINHYCAETLTDFCTKDIQTSAFKKPFKLVEGLGIPFEFLEKQLVEWFPKLNHLSLHNVSKAKTAIDISIPSMKSLTITEYSFEPINDHRTLGQTLVESVRDFLRANQQLNRVSIRSLEGMTFTESLDLIDETPNVLILDIANKISVVHVDELLRMIKKHPLLIDLQLGDYQFSADDAILVIRRLNALRSFSFGIKERTEYDRILNQLDDKWQLEPLESYHHGHVVMLNRLDG